ncbi:MAG: D-alanine--D-alanine ligase, partial [Candidatus Woesebacteria bacterium]|nr:D-alanine--D-alanine ligase [Candidatus Woesebacteria bacterium]
MKIKIKVAVLMGGKSPEHDVSMVSGNEVVKQLDKNIFEVIPTIIPKTGKGIEEILRIKADVVFIAMHGPFGEDGTIQGMMELAGIPYTGSGVTASAVGMDKIMFRKIMIADNLLIPRSVILDKKERNYFGQIEKLGKPPYFVKPHNQGSSVGASIVRNRKELSKAAKLAFKYSDKILVDEYVKGIELTCGVIGNENPIALPVIEIVPKNEFFDYESKYTESGAQEIIPARISKIMEIETRKLAVKVYKAIGANGFGRVDFILKGKKLYILEINTI